MLKFKMVFCLLQSLLMIVSSFSVYDSNFKMFVDRAGLGLTSEKDFGFDRAGAEMFEISEEEKEECRRWFNENILTDKNPAYDFTAGGKSFRKNLSDWEINILPESAQAGKYRNGKTS
ncbi:MAG: hypothetical protein K6F64_10225, partial [Clostridia bacterium]|nr:hypothetical protein [Clostridia bacterium]